MPATTERKRIPCIVPFCGRTATDKGDTDEIICRAHWRMVDRSTRRLHLHLNRKMRLLCKLYPDELPTDQVDYVLRVWAISRKTWAKVQRQAIEAAGGIG